MIGYDAPRGAATHDDVASPLADYRKARCIESTNCVLAGNARQVMRHGRERRLSSTTVAVRRYGKLLQIECRGFPKIGQAWSMVSPCVVVPVSGFMATNPPSRSGIGTAVSNMALSRMHEAVGGATAAVYSLDRRTVDSKRGRPARTWAAGPQVFKRARRTSRPRRHLQLAGAPFLASRASRAPVGRRPTGLSRRSRRTSRPCRHLQLAGAPPFLGSRASRPPVGRRPTGLSRRSGRTSRPRRHLQPAGAPFLASRASRPPRPEAGNGQTAAGSPVCPGGQGAPRARADASSLSERLSWDRGRPARLWAAGPPVCPGGQGAPRARADASGLPERLSWDRGRPARLWAAGPPVCPGGQGAPRARADTSSSPERLSWDRGRPARPGRRPAMDNPPQAHRFVQAVKAPLAPAPTPPACRSAFPGIAGVPPACGPQAHRFVQAVRVHLAPVPAPPAWRSAFPGIAGVPPAPAGGRQWTTRRRPTGLSRRSGRPSRPRRHLQPAGAPFLGSRASRPPRPEAGNGQPAAGHRFVQAVRVHLAPAPTPPACRSAFPGIAGVPPAPAGGRQWTTRRRPTGLSRRSRRPSRPRRHLQLAGAPFLGSRASRPPVGRRPTGLSKRSGCTSRPCRHLQLAGAPFLGSRASRPQVGRRPTGLSRRSGRTSRPRRHLQPAGAPFLGSRASRPPRPEAGNGQPAAGSANSDSRAMPGRMHRGAHPLGSRASRPHVGRRPGRAATPTPCHRHQPARTRRGPAEAPSPISTSPAPCSSSPSVWPTRSPPASWRGGGRS